MRTLVLKAVMSIFLVSALSPVFAVSDDPRCGRLSVRQGYGPHDYRERHSSTRGNLAVVEEYHFTPAMQRDALRGAKSNVWGNLDYTIMAFPNHSRALYLLGVYADKMRKYHKEYFKTLESKETYSPVMCYFKRAIKYAPDDPNVWNALGRLQITLKKPDQALKSFKQVVKLAPKSPAAHYNLGLAYFAAKEYPAAATSARKAYALGHKAQDLKRRLASKGHWK